MAEALPLSVEQWHDYLLRYSAGLIAEGILPDGESPPTDAANNVWLGNPSATEEAIAATESRLGVTLPPSLKNFYRATNGWNHDLTSYGRLHLLPVEEIGWFPDLLPESFLLQGSDEWSEEELQREQAMEANIRSVYQALFPDGSPYSNDSEPAPEPEPDAEEPQEPEEIVLRRSLLISTEGEEAAVWVLDPQNLNANGEWAAACPEVVMGDDWNPDGFAALFVEHTRDML